MPGDDFSTLFDLLPIGAYRSSLDGRQLRANPALVRINGYDTEAQMLAEVDDIGGHWYVQPGRRDEFITLMMAHGEVRDFVSQVRRYRTRELIWVREHARLVRDAQGRPLHYEGTVEDITPGMQAQQSLDAAQAEVQDKSDALRLTLDNAGRGIARVDADGVVVLYNRRLLELLDLPDEMLAARPRMSDVIRFQAGRGDFGDNDELLRVEPIGAATGQRRSIDELASNGTYVRRTRSGRVLEVSSVPLPDGGLVRTYSDVTAYYQAQQELAEKSRILQITLDSMSQGIATIDATGRTVMSNRRHHELLNFPEELMARGPTMEQLVRFQIDRGDFGENFSFVDAIARGYVAVGDKTPPLLGPETYLRKTRDGKWLEVKTRPLPDGGVVRTFTDVTAYVQAQDALTQKEAQLSALINTIPDMVWLIDTEGRYLLTNPAHQRFHDLPLLSALGRTAHEVYGDEVGEAYRRTDLQAMNACNPIVYESQATDRRTGQRVVLEAIKVAMRDEVGTCTGVLGIARDITARKAAEAALIAARDAAEAGNRAKAEFLANMSHEIRTPMNAVIGMSDLLLDTPLSPRQREFAETIRTSGDTLLTLINDILDFSKIESGNLELERVPVNLADCVKTALDLTGALAQAKGLALRHTIDPTLPGQILGDATRLRQVLINLINNAIKFTAQGEVVVTLTRRHGEDGQPLLHASVRDTGIGIPPDRMDRLFQVFSQVDASTTRRFGGTGLGLAICRRLLTLMGGRIWVESRPGEGSDFQFELPVHAVATSPVDVAAVASAGATAGTSNGTSTGTSAAAQPTRPRLSAELPLRILLAEDNPVNQRVASLILSGLGYDIELAVDGREATDAVSRAASAGRPIDVVFMDVQMPVLDGIGATAQITAQHLATRRPWIIAMTANAMEGDREACLAAGMDDYLSKPIRAAAVGEALRRAAAGLLARRGAAG